jgi:putative transposase
VYNRGGNRMGIFVEADDHELFVHLMKQATRRAGVTVHGLVLMTTHFHALATPHSEHAMPIAMKEIGEQYAQYFNHKYRRTGPAWDHRYDAVPMESDSQCLTCLRYIELNPVKASIVDRPDAYRWSSFSVHARGHESDWLVPHRSYINLGRDPRERQLAYRALCAEPISLEELVRLRRRRIAATPP